jgi:hypothetical protein
MTSVWWFLEALFWWCFASVCAGALWGFARRVMFEKETVVVCWMCGWEGACPRDPFCPCCDEDLRPLRIQ